MFPLIPSLTSLLLRPLQSMSVLAEFLRDFDQRTVVITADFGARCLIFTPPPTALPHPSGEVTTFSPNRKPHQKRIVFLCKSVKTSARQLLVVPDDTVSHTHTHIHTRGKNTIRSAKCKKKDGTV